MTNEETFLPPQDLEAERAVLGGILCDNAALDDALEFIEARHYFADFHRKIHAALCDMIGKGVAADGLTLRDEMERRGQLEDIGGFPYITKLYETVPHAAHTGHYAQIVRRHADCRAAVETFTSSLRAIRSPGCEVQDVIASAERDLFAIASGETARVDRKIGSFLTETLQGIVERMDADESSGGLPTGFDDADKILQPGLKPNALVVLAARPGVGKSALAGNVALNVAIRARRQWLSDKEAGEQAPLVPRGGVLLFSLEMGRHELAERILSARSNIDGEKLSRGEFNTIEQAALMAATDEVRELPLFIDETPNQTVSKIVAISRREARRFGLGLVIIDYLQLIQAEDRRQPREQQVADITRRLKVLAKELGIPVVALAQLNRSVEQREDKRPRLSDLRESGAIEQDADVVMFLHRPEVFDPGHRKGEADLIIAKNRGGPLGVAELAWLPSRMKFANKFHE